MNEIKFKYKFGDDFNPDYITGAMGGINPTGEIIMYFYLDRKPLPNKASLFIEGNTVIKEDINDNQNEEFEKTILRYIQSGIVMNLQTAKDIRQWLDDRIKMFDNK